jgi:beta-lactamase regulating signal transducer with metallopeptidase domain
LIESALRALLVALVVWTGLRLFRVSNVIAQKAAWALVLVAAVAMPLVMRWQWKPAYASITVPIPAWQPAADNSPAREFVPESVLSVAPPAPSGAKTEAVPAPRRLSATPQSNAQPNPPAYLVPTPSLPRPAPKQPAGLRLPDPLTSAWLLYLAVCAALLARLAYGLHKALRLWRAAEPVSLHPELNPAPALRLRSSSAVASPVTIGSGLLLPADYSRWDAEKLRIVLAHEGSHIRQGDFYLQLAAALYAAIFWFSPLGWWLKRKLSDLAEAVSDRAALEEAASRCSYAYVLLEFAALPRPTLIGVAMARTSNLSPRIERLLNESSFRRAFTRSRRALLAVLLVPAALFAATALVRVEAAATSKPVAQITAPAQASLPAPTPLPETAAASAVRTQAVLDARLAVPAPFPAVLAAAASSSSDLSFDRTLTLNGKADLSVSTGSGTIHLVHGAANHIHVVGHVRVHPGGSEERAREIAANPPIEQSGNVVRIGQRHEHLEHISIDYEIEAPADSALNASTGSGEITDEGVGEGAKLETGSGSIDATGLRGGFKAETGSGSIHVDRIGEGDVKAETGSGSIDIGEVRGGLQAETGSGEIKVKGRPTKEWKLETGSGEIEFWAGDAPVTIDAETGSGSVHSDREMLTQGTIDRHHLVGKLNGGGPTVRMETGSGSIQIH